MENPATWGEAEKVIADVLQASHGSDLSGEFRAGHSLPKQITVALRQHGLLPAEDAPKHTFTDDEVIEVAKAVHADDLVLGNAHHDWGDYPATDDWYIHNAHASIAKTLEIQNRKTHR